MRHSSRLALLGFALVGFQACTVTPDQAAPIAEVGDHVVSTQIAEREARGFSPVARRNQARREVIKIAQDQIGTPYVFGGMEPGGFDCSGLVYYTHYQVGQAVPRTAAAQFRAAKRVRRHQMKPGDLVFFKLKGRKISHVGIYAGNNRFIHAPSTGKKVKYASLDNPFWSKRFVGAGRYL